MKTYAFSLILALLPLGLPQADTLTIPLGQQSGRHAGSLPSHGMSEHAVLERYGAPTQRHEAVGKPPIRRWDYADFSVYFEHDHVVHSVRQHQPQAAVSP